MCLFNVLAFLSKPERTYGSLTPQLEKVIIEVSTVSRVSAWLLEQSPGSAWPASCSLSLGLMWDSLLFFSGERMAP